MRLETKDLSTLLASLVPLLDFILTLTIPLWRLNPFQIIEEKTDSKVRFLHFDLFLLEVDLTVFEREGQKNFFLYVIRLQWKRRIKNILEEKVILGSWVFFEAHFYVAECFISNPFIWVYDLRGNLLYYKMRSALPYCKVFYGVKEPHSWLLKSTFDAAIKGVEDVAVSGRANFFSEGKAQLEALQAVSVDQTDVELKHIGQ